MKSINTARKREGHNPVKVVFDTNVMVSALLWTGLPHDLLVEAKKGKIVLAMTLEMLVELKEVLTREKFQHRIKTINTNVEELVDGIELIVKIYTTGEKVEVISSDIDDNMFLECAIASNSKYIISGDEHLLNLVAFENIQILSPRDFYNQVLDERKK